MSKVLGCPHCDRQVTVDDQLFGRVMGCPHCGKHFTVASAESTAVAVAAPMGNFPYSMHSVRFTFSCMRCASVLEARGNHGGTKGRCPTCGAIFTIPEVDPSTGLPMRPAAVEDDGQLPTPMHAYATAGDKAPQIVRNDSGELMIVCPRCSRHCNVDVNQCPACGTPFTIEGAEAVVHGSGEANGLATAAFVISVLGWCIPGAGLVAVGIGWAALVKANEMGQARPGYGLAVAAIIVGLLSLGFFGLQWL